MDNVGLPEILDLVTSIGNWIIFFVLFYRKDQQLEEARKAHRDDLREIAGMDAYLRRPSSNPANPQAVPRTPFPRDED